MRILTLVTLLVVIAAAPAVAQKPGFDPARDAWRDQGIAQCVAELASAEGITPDELESICGCGVDRFLSTRPTGPLPPLGGGDRLQMMMGGPILACAAEERPALTASVARRLAQSASASIPPPVVAVPPRTEAPEPAPTPDKPQADEGAGFHPLAWFDTLSLPAWLTDSGIPLWGWAGLVILGIAALRLLRRGGGGGRDLLGPPPSMRRGVPTPRRPDRPPPR